jgi:protocatechuate 3,4-dioxygenase beta subunit
VHEAGRPLPGATLALRAPGQRGRRAMPDFMGRAPQVRTDGEGAYAFEKVKAGEYRLEVTHAGRAMSYETAVIVEEGENALDIELPLAVIRGRVEDERGKPVAGARVRVERVGEESDARRGRAEIFMMDDGDGQRVTLGGQRGAMATTDEDGRYELRGVLTDVPLVVRAEGDAFRPARSGELEVDPDEVKSGVDLELALGAAVEVTCLKPDGSAGSFSLVRATFLGEEPKGVDPQQTVTNQQGVAKLTGMAPGKWRVTARPIGPNARDGAEPEPQEIEVEAGATRALQFKLP